MGAPELMWDDEPLVYLGETQIDELSLPRRVELLMAITQEDRDVIKAALQLAADELAPRARATDYRRVVVDQEARETPAWQLLCRIWRLGKPYGHIARSAVTLSAIDWERREVGMNVADDPRGGYFLLAKTSG